MKARYLLASLGAIALTGCTVYRPVAYTPVVTTPATVAVTPTYVVPNTTILGGSANWSLIDSDGDGFNNGVDRQPYNSLFR
jgi:hypothetical protein